jgi:hypothetical protein
VANQGGLGHGEEAYIRLTDSGREVLSWLVKTLRVSSQKLCRARIHLRADPDGPNWTDAEIADTFDCRARTAEFLRELLVTEGFGIALGGKPKSRIRSRVLDGEQEAKIITLRLGQPPKGFANRSLRLLAGQAVALAIVESISYESLRRTPKKTA